MSKIKWSCFFLLHSFHEGKGNHAVYYFFPALFPSSKLANRNGSHASQAWQRIPARVYLENLQQKHHCCVQDAFISCGQWSAPTFHHLVCFLSPLNINQHLLALGTAPGPVIHLKENQTTWIRVHNDLPYDNTTIVRAQLDSGTVNTSLEASWLYW